MENTKVTVVTVTYNAKDVLEETILSVINQSYDNIEYIIIDGGSTDGTIDIIKKYEDKIDYWISEPDDGIYFAMNKAIEKATGKWINFMNAGDTFVDNNTIENIKNEFIEENDIIFGSFYAVEDSNKKSHRIPNIKRLKYELTINHQTMFTKSSILKKYHFNTFYKICADYDFELKCETLGYRFKYVDVTIANFMLNGVNQKYKLLTRIEACFIISHYYGTDNLYDSMNFDQLLSHSKISIEKTKTLDKQKKMITTQEDKLLKQEQMITTQEDKLLKQEQMINLIENLTKISIFKRPIQKYKAYKSFLMHYYKLKKL